MLAFYRVCHAANREGFLRVRKIRNPGSLQVTVGKLEKLDSLGSSKAGRCSVCFSLNQRILISDRGKKLIRCTDCGLCFLEPPPSEEQVSEYFTKKYITTQEKLETSFSKNRQHILRRVAQAVQRCKERGRILDIGCAGGYFLDCFFHKSEWELWGVELSKFAAGKAAEKGIRVHVGDIHSAGFAPAYFDVVSILDTFYYFPEPRRELRAIKTILRPDGMLVLELPSARSRIWRSESRFGRAVAGPSRSLLQGDNFYFYTPESVSFLLEGCGFKRRLLVPLPGNRQRKFLSNAFYKTYFGFSSLFWHLSVEKIMLGPRFLITAFPV